jgi:MGT family glycosyltransferase
MSPAPVAVFAMIERGHFQRLRPLIAGLVDLGVPVHVFTDARFREDAEAAGGTFVDLFAKYPIEGADDASIPLPCRAVSFAGAYADQLIDDLRRLEPSLVVYDTFAVIGHVAARALGIPYVNVCAGHNADPAETVPALEADPRVDLSPACLDAVETLRTRHGLEDASPFSYMAGISPHLNLYCEPPAFLTEDERRPFEPMAFFGSLPTVDELDAHDRDEGQSPFGAGPAGLRIYVSFGTIVWRYWAAEALDALATIAEAFAARDDVRALVSLGGADVAAESIQAIAKPNVAVERWVDQWRVLQDADAFVTHHGLNSTHEAIYNEVPMISYPFTSDQPGMAERCRELGLAVPLVGAPRETVTTAAVESALASLSAKAGAMRPRLAEAREWERQVISGREAVLERITALAGD